MLRFRFRLSAAVLAVVSSVACDSFSVTSPDPFTVVVEPTQVVLAIGEATQFSATVRNENGDLLADQPVTWAIDDAGVASLTQAGQVVAVGLGSATITATSGPASGTADIVVQSNGS